MIVNTSFVHFTVEIQRIKAHANKVLLELFPDFNSQHYLFISTGNFII